MNKEEFFALSDEERLVLQKGRAARKKLSFGLEKMTDKEAAVDPAVASDRIFFA